MNASATDLGRAVRDATEQFLVGDAALLADNLSEALIVLSARLAAFRKRLPARGVLAFEMQSVDEAFTGSVVVARKLSAAIRAHRDQGAYADVARVARDLGRHLAPALPEGTEFTIACPSTPALATMPPSDVRRVLSMIVRRLLESLGGSTGDLALEVSEVRSGSQSRAEVRVFVGHGALRPSVAADAADDVRSSVNANGGSVEPCARHGGGAAVALLLPGAC
jgi:hypothetical protein